MVDTAQLPSILRLVDDVSPTVRQAVFVALASFGDELAEQLGRLEEPLPAEALEQLLADVADFRETGKVPGGVVEETPRVEAVDEDDDDDFEDDEAFEVGQLVRHRRYGYRGVIVAIDPECLADDEWYRNNRTQPPREQPWYHVLVSETDKVTYAAQSNLVADDSDEAIDHPLVEHFFDGRDGARYTRNDQPWPGWEHDT